MSNYSNLFFENNDVVVFHKPANLLSVRSRFHSEKPEENILDQNPGLLPVHRLDREVEGLLMAAKNKNSQCICQSWFEKKLIKKSYRALSCKVDLSPHGKLPFQIEKIDTENKNSFSWKSKILRGKKRSFESPHGDESHTLAKLEAHSVLSNGIKVYQWTLHPITGRSHQLRFELAKHEHPILGDSLYFAPLMPQYPEAAIALISQSLDFHECPEREALGLPEMLSLNLSWEMFLSRLKVNATLIADKE